MMSVNADYSIGGGFGADPSMETMDRLFLIAQSAVNAQHEITQSIFDNIKKADKELEQFTKKLEENRLPNKLSTINNLQTKAEKLLSSLNLPASSNVNPQAIQDERSKLIAVMGQLQDMKQQAAAKPPLASSQSFGAGTIV